MLFLSRDDVERLVDLDRLVDALARAMADLSAGATSMPPRSAAEVEGRGFLGVMPSFVPSLNTLAVKLVSLFPENRDRPTHQAVIACFDPDNGTPVAVMEGGYITEARTAAGSALATRLLADPEARVLAILGTGVQARSHARAIPRVRPIEVVRVAGRDPDRATALVEELTRELDIAVEPAASYEAALDGAEVVCAATHSPDPVVRREWLSPGAHVNSIGFNTAGREIDERTVAEALVVIESRASTLAPPPAGSNDLLWPIRDGLITEDHVHAEIGELVSGAAPGRTSPDQITLYKSVGVAVQDATAAALVLDAARAAAAGTSIDL